MLGMSWCTEKCLPSDEKKVQSNAFLYLKNFRQLQNTQPLRDISDLDLDWLPGPVTTEI